MPAVDAPHRPARIDQWALHKALFMKSQGHILPEHVGKMTLAEIAMVLDDADRGPYGTPALSVADAEREVGRRLAWRPLDWLRNFDR